MSDLVGLLVLGAAGAVVVLLVERATRDTVVGAGLVLASFLLAELGLDPSIALGPFRVETRDVATVVVAVAAVARLLRARRVPGPVLALAAFLAVVVVSTALGAAEHGVGAAVNEARKYLRFGAVGLYVATIAREDDEVRDRVVRLVVATGWALLVVSLVRWASYFTGVPVPLTGRPPDLRVIDSFATLVLLQALMVEAAGVATSLAGSVRTARLDPRRSRAARRFVTLAVGAVILLQHRTLWIALLLGAVLLMARDPRATRRLLVRATVGALLVAVATFSVLGQGADRVVLEDLEGSATEVATFDWRVEGWGRLVEENRPHDLQGWLLGAPFGGGFERMVEGRVVAVSPHNYYLETFLRTGLVGSLLLVGLTAWVVVRTLRSSGGRPTSRDDALGICVTLASLYYLTSHATIEQGVVLGLAVSAALARAPSPGSAGSRPAVSPRTGSSPARARRT